jgi:polysaccharide biosynthesis protein PslH
VKILVLATKAPWPPRDGGRLLLANTLAGLADAGLRPVLVAPFEGDAAAREEVAAALAGWCVPVLVPARPTGPLPALARSLTGGVPFSVARHSLAAVRREAARRLAAERFDLVHAEQLQALPQAAAAAELGIPVVLRAQNVESDLWGALSRWRRGWRGRMIAAEARRIAAWEGEAVRRATATAALTEADARRLRELAGTPGDRVRVVAAPFAPTLRPGSSSLFGDPPVVVLGSRGWLPNEDGAAWFQNEVWPAVRAVLPGAVLHLFGAAGPSGAGPAGSVVLHPAPGESAAAFDVRALLAVPLRIASGVRMKILEAWARGVPVVGTPEAVAGLGAHHGRELLVAGDAADFAAALARLHREPALARSLVAGGRAALRSRHAPRETTRALLAVYQEAMARGAER